MANTPQWAKPIGNELSTTLASGITNVATSITVASASGFSATGGYIIIDEGNASEEVVYVESVSGSVLTVATDGRGRCGTSAVAHNSGATVTDIIVDEMFTRPRTSFLVEHNDSGTHKQLNAQLALSNTTISTSNRLLDEGFINMIEGFLINGKIERSVASNDLTIALKTNAGTDASSTNPIYAMIGGTRRKITAALSLTLNDGTNWMDLGSTELATYENDLFVYLGYRASDTSVFIGVARFPTARTYGDFSSTNTNDKYLGYSGVAPASTDDVVVIGRVNATLSAGAAYTWSVPATSVIVQRPIFESRWLDYGAVTTPAGSMTYTSLTWRSRRHKVDGDLWYVRANVTGTTGGTASDTIDISTPIEANLAASESNPIPIIIADGGNTIIGAGFITATAKQVNCRKVDSSNWSLGANRIIGVKGSFIY